MYFISFKSTILFICFDGYKWTSFQDSKKLVFHVLTDRQNYYAMKLWFMRNTFKKASIEVLNIEEYNVIPGSSLPEEFRVTLQSHKLLKMHYETQYVSLFSHSHYLLPEIFKNLDKIVVLDDDIVVQQDLTALWRINMGGMVNGAAEICAVRLGQLDNYLGKTNFNRNSCVWMSGLNVIDLVRWRDHNITTTFRKMVEVVSCIFFCLFTFLLCLSIIRIWVFVNLTV